MLVLYHVFFLHQLWHVHLLKHISDNLLRHLMVEMLTLQQLETHQELALLQDVNKLNKIKR